MSSRELKARLRKERLACRDAMAPDLRTKAAAAIAGHADAIAFPQGAAVSGFWPIRSEVDIVPLMEKLRARGARLCLPVIVDRETIVFREHLADTPLIASGFGTTGPGPEAAEVDPDLMLVPLSAFDARGHRIGYGAGYYDRAIDRLREKGRHPMLVGIAFACQEVASVPAEPHDVALDAILTEDGLRYFGQGRRA